MEKVKALDFYKAWTNVVSEKEQELSNNWYRDTDYTKSVISSEASVINSVSELLGLKCYNKDYYCIDSILYLEEDFVPRKPKGSYWFKDIRVAFEHENQFGNNLFQEVSHLLITNCDLMVLVTYPHLPKEKDVMKYLHEIILSSRRAKSISDSENFMMIFGKTDPSMWSGHIFKESGWKNLPEKL